MTNGGTDETDGPANPEEAGPPPGGPEVGPGDGVAGDGGVAGEGGVGGEAPAAAPLSPPPPAPPPPPPPPPGYGGSVAGSAAAVGGLATLNAPRRPSAVAPLVASVLMAAFLLATAGLAAAQTVSSGANATRVTLTNCSGSGTSLSHSGATIQSASAPSGKASPTHPFLVAYNGTVPYQGKSAEVITNHHWHVSVFNVQVKSGGSRNSQQEDTSSGTEKVKDYLPVKLTGLFYVSGSISGAGGSCAGAVWVKLTGSPIGSVLWIVGIVLAVIGLLFLAIGRPIYRRMGAGRMFRRHPITGLIGGIIGGAGFAALVVSYAKAPYGTNTPWVILIGLSALGLVWGIFGPRRGRRRAGF